MKYIIFAFIFLIPLRCMSEKLVFLDEVQTKTMNVAFSHFREHTNWGLFNTMYRMMMKILKSHSIVNLIWKKPVVAVWSKLFI